MNTVKTHAAKGIKQVELLNWLLNNLQQFNLKPTTKLVLLYLAGCYNPKHADVFPKQKTIALQMGISEASVIRAIAELHKEGLIISERKYSNRYKFTAKVLSLGTQVEDFYCDNKMQVENSQNAISETCNLQAPCIEQKEEQIKEQNVDVLKVDFSDYKILKTYAIKHGAKNVNAYVNVLKKNGSAKEIIDEHIKAENNKLYLANKTKEALQDIETAKLNAAPPTESWKALGEKLKRLAIN